MKTIIRKTLLVLFGVSFIYWLQLFYSGRYKPIELKYLGSADGTGGVSYYVTEQKRNFMYCGFGYDIFDLEMIDNWNLHNFDFNLKLQESKKYIISFGVPLERLEYLDHYSRATYSKDKIQEGRFYFYEIDNIPITKWGELELEMVNVDADRTFDEFNMLYRKVYQSSQTELKERFLNRTVRTDCFTMMKIKLSRDVRKRIYFGELENCKFDLYSYPDLMGSLFSAPWLFPWRGMSMWASPTHAYGTIYGTEEQAIIDCYIIKSDSIKRNVIFGFVMLSLPLITIRSWIWKFDLYVIIEIFFMLAGISSLLIASLYIPKSEKEILIKFLDDLGLENSRYIC